MPVTASLKLEAVAAPGPGVRVHSAGLSPSSPQASARSSRGPRGRWRPRCGLPLARRVWGRDRPTLLRGRPRAGLASLALDPRLQERPELKGPRLQERARGLWPRLRSERAAAGLFLLAASGSAPPPAPQKLPHRHSRYPPLLPSVLKDPCSLAVAQDLTEDEETVEDSIIEDEDDEAEVEEDEPTDLVEDKEEEDVSGEPEASPSADTTILFVKGEDFPANNIVKFLVGFTNKGTEDFIVESLDASFRYPQDYQFYIQNFTALPLNTVVPPQRQATFEYSFIPAEPMGGRPFGLVINLNYKDLNGNVFQDAVFNQTVTVIEKEDGLDGETIFMYMFLAGLGLLVIVGLHQLLESRKRKRPIQKVEMGTSSQNDVDMSWIPQETLNQIMQSRRDKASPRRLPRKRAQKRSVGSDERRRRETH
uniref:Translocon-associated protein subunit alpha n=3 Tax=Simiiformes TaxID=314293 RepID=A0A2K5HJE2_COLAP